jgi:hypothetical protein
MSKTKLAGTLDVNNQPVINVPDPINPLDAVNLQTLQSVNGNTNIKTYTAGENINSHTPVALVGDKIYQLNVLDPLHTFSYVGFTLTSCLINTDVEVIKEGVIFLIGWGLIPDRLYQADYMISPLSTSRPNDVNFQQVFGYSLDSDTLLLRDFEPMLPAY